MKPAAHRLLILCSDTALRDSLVDLFSRDGRHVVTDGDAATPGGGGRAEVVVVASEAWPPGWNLARLRAAYGRVPCVLLSGSPLGGPYTMARFQRGYFVSLPALPSTLLGVVAELSRG